MQETTPTTPPTTPTSRFKAEMPRIPGVTDAPPPSRIVRLGKSAIFLVTLGVALTVIGGIAWWAFHSIGQRPSPAPQLTETLPNEPEQFSPEVSPTVSGPVAAATLADLAKPWSAREFTFFDPVSHRTVPALVLHLAKAASNSSSSYWAFSLETPYGSCQLQYVTDLKVLADHFNYQATHPMVVSPCEGTVYDPLKIGSNPDGAWVRGEIVQGAGIRPPIMIEIKVQGRSLIADRIE